MVARNLTIRDVAAMARVSQGTDPALAAFDDYPYYAYLSPPLTAVRNPTPELGLAALDMLFTLMEGREPESRSLVLPAELVIRSSCGS